jgi:hypothetical protein
MICADRRDSLVRGTNADGNLYILRIGQREVRIEHVLARPCHEFGVHFPDKNERCLVFKIPHFSSFSYFPLPGELCSRVKDTVRFPMTNSYRQ